MNLSSQWFDWCSSQSELSSSSESVWINWNWRSKAAISTLDALTSFLLTSDEGRLKGDDRSIEWDFQEREDSSDDPLLKTFFILSTKLNLCKLDWLPDFAGLGGDGLFIDWLFVGLIISDDWDVREFTREILLKRPPAECTWWRLRCDGDPIKGSFWLGDVE